jgi:microcompartment protein CcmK/EutM
MRLGIVRGHVVLSAAVPSLAGSTLLLVEPVTAANLAARNGQGGGKTLVVADRLSPATGQMIGVVEGREAANPYHPTPTPVDACCALIVHDYTFQPPAGGPGVEGPEGRS